MFFFLFLFFFLVLWKWHPTASVPRGFRSQIRLPWLMMSCSNTVPITCFCGDPLELIRDSLWSFLSFLELMVFIRFGEYWAIIFTDFFSTLHSLFLLSLVLPISQCASWCPIVNSIHFSLFLFFRLDSNRIDISSSYWFSLLLLKYVIEDLNAFFIYIIWLFSFVTSIWLP